MNSDDANPNVDEFDPSWMGDGGGIQGEQTDPDWSEDAQWDTRATSEDNIIPEDFIGAGGSCLATAGDPPGSGTWVLGSIGGTCQWIDTTTCP